MKYFLVVAGLFISCGAIGSELPWREGKSVEPLVSWGKADIREWNNFYLGDLCLKQLRGNTPDESEAEKQGEIVRLHGVVYARLEGAKDLPNSWWGIPVEYTIWVTKETFAQINADGNAEKKVMSRVAVAVQGETKANHFLKKTGIGWGDKNKTQLDPEQALYYNLYLKAKDAINDLVVNGTHSQAAGSSIHHCLFNTAGEITTLGKLSQDVIVMNAGIVE